MMLPLEIKQSGAKLIPHSVLRGGVFLVLGEASRKIHREMKLDTWNFRSFYRAGSLKAAARELARYKILGWISRRWDVGIWTGLGWPRIGTGGGRL